MAWRAASQTSSHQSNSLFHDPLRSRPRYRSGRRAWKTFLHRTFDGAKRVASSACSWCSGAYAEEIAGHDFGRQRLRDFCAPAWLGHGVRLLPHDHHLLGYPQLPRAYRVVTLHQDGRVASSVPVSAGSDLEALTLAETLRTGLAVELWDGLRFIEHFKPRALLFLAAA